MEDTLKLYNQARIRSLDPAQRDQYWKEYAEEITWTKFPQTILDSSKAPFYKWFPDGEMNMCYNCIDRHLETEGDKKALIYESNFLNISSVLTFKQLHLQVCKFAGLLKALDLQIGDRVIIYMPMIPESIIAIFGTIRLGGIHSVVFGGFAAKELANRIMDSTPTVIVTASCGIEPHKTIDYKKILDEALKMSKSSAKVIIVQREKMISNQLTIGRDIDYHSAMLTV